MTMKSKSSAVILSRRSAAKDPLPSRAGDPSLSSASLRQLRMTGVLFLILAAFTARAQTFDLEAGYRWLDLKGDEGMYRTQIDERSGFLIRAFTMNSSSPLADRIRVDVSDLGTGPAGALRGDAARAGPYHLRPRYRSAGM